MNKQMHLFVAALLLLIQTSCISWKQIAFAVDLSPFLDRNCNGVECGKGTCKIATNELFGFECECNAGWSQLRFDDRFRFLPCVIPNCAYDSPCYNDTIARPISPSIPHTSLFDPCLWSFCGEGTCVKTSQFEHRCECNDGYNNLLNISSLPCIRECKIQADCIILGFTLWNSSSAPSSTNIYEPISKANTSKTTCWLYIFSIILLAWPWL